MTAKLETIEKVYLFTGEVDPRRQEAVNRLTGLVNPDFAAFDLEFMDGESVSAPDVLSAVTTVPFASERKVVLVENIDRMSADDQTRIAEFLPKLTPKSCLVLLTSERSGPSRASAKKKESENGDEQDGRKKGLSQKLKAAVAKHGAVEDYKKLKPAQLQSIAVDEARKLGRKLDARAAEALSQSVDANILMLRREVEKLAAYTEGKSAITLEDVEQLVPRSPEDRVFHMIDAVGGKHPEQAVKLLNETLEASAKPEEEVMRILSMLARHFRMLYQMVYLRSEAGVKHPGAVSEDLLQLLPKDHNAVLQADFPRKKMWEQSRYFTSAQIRTALRSVLTCELSVKGVEGESGLRRLNLEMLIMRLCERK